MAKIYRPDDDYNSSSPQGGQITYNGSCFTDINCNLGEACNFGFCSCRLSFEFSEQLQTCIKCPDFGEWCSDCCYGGLKCVDNYCLCPSESGYFNMCHPQSGVFITASQIALSAALVMGIAALAMVIYRLCTKPRYLTARQRDSQRLPELPSARNNNILRASLSSIQIRVLSRLRDRPPTYESQTNTTTISQRVERNARPNNLPEAPPPYEGRRDSADVRLPPPYTEVIVSPTVFFNSTYSETDTSLTITRFGENAKDEPAK